MFVRTCYSCIKFQVLTEIAPWIEGRPGNPTSILRAPPPGQGAAHGKNIMGKCSVKRLVSSHLAGRSPTPARKCAKTSLNGKKEIRNKTE